MLVPRTNQLADVLKESEIKDRFRLLAARRKSRVWFRAGSQVLEAERFDTERGVARDLTIYEIGDDGLPVSRVDATSARHVGRGVWRLYEPARVEVASHEVKRVPSRRFANLGETVRAKVDTMHFSVFELGEEIRELQADDVDTTTLEVDYFVKIAEPLACIVLPAVVLFFAVGGPPFPGPAKTLLVSGVVAVAYVLLTGVGASLGYGGTVSPRLAGWGPAFFFAVVAAYFGYRLWRRL